MTVRVTRQDTYEAFAFCKDCQWSRVWFADDEDSARPLEAVTAAARRHVASAAHAVEIMRAYIAVVAPLREGDDVDAPGVLITSSPSRSGSPRFITE